MIKVAVTGALGRMGTLVIQELSKFDDLQLVAGLDAVGAGKMLAPGGVVVSDALMLKKVLASTKPDVLIDFTIASAAVENVCSAAETGVNLVVGTTGFSNDQLSKMKGAIQGSVA